MIRPEETEHIRLGTAINFGAGIDRLFARICRQLGLKFHVAVTAPLLAVEMARAEKGQGNAGGE